MSRTRSGRRTLDNAFGYSDVAPYLERGSVLDNQRAVTVKGTFLQNREYLDLFYRDNETVVEMEAGPYLAALYEATQASRHPFGEAVHLRNLPMDLGFIHYASDTPYTRVRTLGSRGLSFDGVDSTYASAVAILRRIFDARAHAAPALVMLTPGLRPACLTRGTRCTTSLECAPRSSIQPGLMVLCAV